MRAWGGPMASFPLRNPPPARGAPRVTIHDNDETRGPINIPGASNSGAILDRCGASDSGASDSGAFYRSCGQRSESLRRTGSPTVEPRREAPSSVSQGNL